MCRKKQMSSETNGKQPSKGGIFFPIQRRVNSLRRRENNSKDYNEKVKNQAQQLKQYVIYSGEKHQRGLCA